MYVVAVNHEGADIGRLLENWPYDPERTVRVITAADGRSLIQVRQPLGIEQYEMDGRPDGNRPAGYPTVLAAIQARLQAHIVENGGDSSFEVTTEDAERLQSEGVLFYYRYLILYQLDSFDLVVRDTQHNLDLCELLERYCSDEAARDAVLQFRPYILRVHAAARALAMNAGQMDGDPIDTIEAAIERISSLSPIDSPAFQFERARSTNYLRALAARISGDGDGGDGDDDEENTSAIVGVIDVVAGANDPESESPTERIRRELDEAVAREEYERAATLRDELRRAGGLDG